MEVDLSNKLQIIYILFFFFSPQKLYTFNISQKGKRASWLKGAFIPS